MTTDSRGSPSGTYICFNNSKKVHNSLSLFAAPAVALSSVSPSTCGPCNWVDESRTSRSGAEAPPPSCGLG